MDLPELARSSYDIQFGKAKEAGVQLDLMIKGGAESYINHGTYAVLDTRSNWRMAARVFEAIVMGIFLVFCPLARIFKPIKRPEPEPTRKMMTEAGLNGLIIFLGWLIDSR